MAYTAIDDPELYFQVKLYTGDGSTPSITLDGDEDMQPDLVWIKNRDEADSHCLFDSVRTATKLLYPDTADDEEDDADTLTSFDSDGFALGDDDKVNTDTEAYVAWCWKESATAGFDIVSYTGNATNRTISHSLSAVPEAIITKCRSAAARSWTSYHAPLGNGKHMTLSETDAEATSSASWNDTTPTSSVFSLGTSNNVNDNTETHIAYCFAPIQGFSKFGSYTGNSQAGTSSPFVYTGFRPAWVMIKNTADTHGWSITDSKRTGYNENSVFLYANANDADASYPMTSFYSNGFQPIEAGADKGAVNQSGDVYIYMAFAEAPFVNSNGVPCNAR